MVKKLHSAQTSTPSWAHAGDDNEAWKENSGKQVSEAHPATESPLAGPAERPALAPPGQQTPVERITEASSIEPVKAPPAPADIRRHPKDLGVLFAKRPLVLGEVEADYDEHLSRVTTAVKAADAIETLWVKDVVDLM